MMYKDVFKNIKSVGVELEGGVPSSALDVFEKEAEERGLEYYSIGYDGSVRVYPLSPQEDWIPDAEIRFHSSFRGQPSRC
ncbi:MAG: hypothetical protein QXW41_07355 [Fervidicoccaceae archaeon]